MPHAVQPWGTAPPHARMASNDGLLKSSTKSMVWLSSGGIFAMTHVACIFLLLRLPNSHRTYHVERDIPGGSIDHLRQVGAQARQSRPIKV